MGLRLSGLFECVAQTTSLHFDICPSCLSGRWTNHNTTWDVLYVLRPGENRDFVWAPCCLGSGDGERSLSPGGSQNWVPCGTTWGPFFRVIMTGLKGCIPQSQNEGARQLVLASSALVSISISAKGGRKSQGQCRGHFCRDAWCCF